MQALYFGRSAPSEASQTTKMELFAETVFHIQNIFPSSTDKNVKEINVFKNDFWYKYLKHTWKRKQKLGFLKETIFTVDS